MRKSLKKLKLNRETLDRLNASELRAAAGGIDDSYHVCTFECVSGPYYECFGTFDATCRC